MRRGLNSLKVHGEEPKSMNRQVFNFVKQRNEKAQPGLQRLEKIAGKPRKELSQDT